MKIPFNIKYRPQIESGEYRVVRRDSLPVRIICWDAKTTSIPSETLKPIISLVEIDSEESVVHHYENGTIWKSDESIGDLFIIIPEPKLTELERAIKREMICAGLEGVSTTIIKETAKEVKGIICKGCTVGLDQYWKGRDDARKEYEKSITYHYPTCQPPCPYEGICTNPMRDCTTCPNYIGKATISTTSGTCKKD